MTVIRRTKVVLPKGMSFCDWLAQRRAEEDCHQCGERLPDFPVRWTPGAESARPYLFCSYECNSRWYWNEGRAL